MCISGENCGSLSVEYGKCPDYGVRCVRRKVSALGANHPAGVRFTGLQGWFWKSRRLLECPDSVENRSNGSNDRFLKIPNGFKGLRKALRGKSVRISEVCWSSEASQKGWRPCGLGGSGFSGVGVSVIRDGYSGDVLITGGC